MPYFMIAVGEAPNLRYGQGSDDIEACKDAFGSSYSSKDMTASKLPKSPKYLSSKTLSQIQKHLIEEHKNKMNKELQA